MNFLQYAYTGIVTELETRRHIRNKTREIRKAGDKVDNNHESDVNNNEVIENSMVTEDAGASNNNESNVIETPDNKGSENEIQNNPNYNTNLDTTKQSTASSKDENTSDSAVNEAVQPEPVEAASTAIPRVEDTHVSGDRPADFSSLVKKEEESKGRIPDLIKASRTLPQAEKDLPPEERSIQSCVINYMTDGAIDPQIMFDPSTIPQYDFQMNPSINPNPYIYDASSGIAVPQQQQQAATIPVDYGSFKVDNPQPQKPKVEKAQPDKVEGVDQIADMVESATESLGVEDTNKRSKYTVFQTTPTSTPRISLDEINPSIQSNNQEMIKKYWWLEGVEKAANTNGCTVSFVEGIDQNGNPNGIMFIYAFTKNGDAYVFNQYKSFIIDYGKLFYDGRIKAFLTIDPNEITYRMLNAFEVIDNSEKNTKKWKEDFLNTIFKAGIMAIDPKSGIYTERLRQLNVIVDQASAPSGKMKNKENRANARNRLFNSIDAGVFAHAKSYDPNCRFVYHDFDAKSKVFLIVNNATPSPISILYTPENATVLYGNIQDSINKFEEAKNKFRSIKNNG